MSAEIVVDASTLLARFSEETIPVWLGRSGSCRASDKSEGDGKTPLGHWSVGGALLRPEQGMLPPAHLPWRWLRRGDGWSDDPRDPSYNRPVRHPHRFSAERLWREDRLYDAILWLDHNAEPPVPGKGSAIFLHLSADRPTEGCVAFPRDAMARLLARLPARSSVLIR